MRVELINQCKVNSDKAEITRIFESYKSRLRDFCDKNNIDVDALLVVNPEFSQLKEAKSLTDTNYVIISDSVCDSTENISNLVGRLRFFNFGGVGIEKLLFIIKSPEESMYGSRQEATGSSNVKECFLNDLDLDRLNHWITNYREHKNTGAFMCFVGESGTGKSSTIEYISNSLNLPIEIISIKDVFANKKIVENLSNSSCGKIVVLDNFDFLFADSRPEKPIVTELETLRISILKAIDLKSTLLIMTLSNASILSNEFKSRISFFLHIEIPSYSVRYKMVSSRCSDCKKSELIASRLSGFSHREIFAVLDMMAKMCDDIAQIDNSLLSVLIDDAIKNREQLFSPDGSDFKVIKPSVSLDKVVMSPENKEVLLTALSSVINESLIYDEWGFRDIDPNVRSIINFFGPPGTGKTMCANAIANELSISTGKQYELLSLNYSEIESMYVGEAPKKLEKVFNYARNKNVVLFFDEADSFLGKRINNVSQGAEQAINSLRSTMLIQLEKYNGVVIFATNLVTNYDQAFKTRFLAEIEFKLPDKGACKSIILLNIPQNTKNRFAEELCESELDQLSEKALGLSGRDIKTVIWRVLAKAARLHGRDYKFSYNDFASEIDAYKLEKQPSPVQSNTPSVDKAQSTNPQDCEKVKKLLKGE